MGKKQMFKYNIYNISNSSTYILVYIVLGSFYSFICILKMKRGIYYIMYLFCF